MEVAIVWVLIKLKLSAVLVEEKKFSCIFIIIEQDTYKACHV